jgi:hypothetical protein
MLLHLLSPIAQCRAAVLTWTAIGVQRVSEVELENSRAPPPRRIETIYNLAIIGELVLHERSSRAQVNRNASIDFS